MRLFCRDVAPRCKSSAAEARDHTSAAPPVRLARTRVSRSGTAPSKDVDGPSWPSPYARRQTGANERACIEGPGGGCLLGEGEVEVAGVPTSPVQFDRHVDGKGLALRQVGAAWR